MVANLSAMRIPPGSKSSAGNGSSAESHRAEQASDVGCSASQRRNAASWRLGRYPFGTNRRRMDEWQRAGNSDARRTAIVRAHEALRQRESAAGTDEGSACTAHQARQAVRV